MRPHKYIGVPFGKIFLFFLPKSMGQIVLGCENKLIRSE